MHKDTETWRGTRGDPAHFSYNLQEHLQTCRESARPQAPGPWSLFLSAPSPMQLCGTSDKNMPKKEDTRFTGDAREEWGMEPQPSAALFLGLHGRRRTVRVVYFLCHVLLLLLLSFH